MWSCLTLRDHLWHERDLSAKLAAIRYSNQALGDEDKDKVNHGWGRATSMFAEQGDAVGLDVRTPVPEQIAWLQRQQPAYLLSYPSNLAALAQYSIANDIQLPGLKEVRCLGEKLGPQVRPLCKQAWGVQVKDMYSAEEVGYMALQCPQAEHYHVQSEHVLLEVLNEHDQPCAVGETGRVVVTALNNFAKPLIRYVIGDYAEVGAPCACGRGLMVLNEVMGRTRNMFIRPDGTQFWPSMPRIADEYLRQLPALRQYQYVQKAADWIELRIMVSAPYSSEIENAFTEGLRLEYGYPYRVTFSYVDDIPRSGRNKYEEFLSEI